MGNKEKFHGAMNNLIDIYIQKYQIATPENKPAIEIEARGIIQKIIAIGELMKVTPREYLNPETNSNLENYHRIILGREWQSLISELDKKGIIADIIQESKIRFHDGSTYTEQEKLKMFNEGVKLIIHGRKITGPISRYIKIRTEF